MRATFEQEFLADNRVHLGHKQRLGFETEQKTKIFLSKQEHRIMGNWWRMTMMHLDGGGNRFLKS